LAPEVLPGGQGEADLPRGLPPSHPTLKRARQRRDEARDLLEEKVDPSAQRKEDKAARRNAEKNTSEAIGREWFAKRSKAWAPTNAVKVAGRLEKDVYPWLGSDPVTEITGQKILETLRRVEQRGSVESAHRVRQSVNAILRYAIDTHRLKANPTPHADALERPKKGKFASITDPKGVGGLIRALSGYHGSLVTRVALQLAPLAFVRPGELRAAGWSEFDTKSAEWRIPAGRMKGRVPHVVPLSHQALTLIDEVRSLTGTGRFVFPSERGHQRPMSANTLNAALRALGYAKDQMTAHGFRTMASTMLNESGKWRHDARLRIGICA